MMIDGGTATRGGTRCWPHFGQTVACVVLIAILSAVLIACRDTSGQAPATEEEWLVLFNGTNLDGWTPKFTGYAAGEDIGSTFRVRDSLLQVRYDAYDTFDGRFGHLFYKTPYSHYILHIEYRFVGRQLEGGPAWAHRNSGVMLHAQAPQSMRRDQQFPTSIEAQFLGGTGNGQRTTLNVCTPGTDVVINDSLASSHCTASKAAAADGAEWVAVDLIVLGDSVIHHVVEADTVMTYARPQLERGVALPENAQLQGRGDRIAGGFIALQAESHPIDFRDVRLLNLRGCTDSRAANYRPYYVASNDAACVY